MNGFGANSSDMDLCLMLTKKSVDQRTLAISVLSQVSRALDSADGGFYFDYCVIIYGF